ncbi:MAG: hypothetical protein RR033_02710 [Clostridia bacterium]
MGKRVILLLEIFLLALIAMAGCNLRYNNDSFSVSGIIIFNKNPLDGVEVGINGAFDVSLNASDVKGYFNVANLKYGDKISFRKEGYNIEEYEVKYSTIEVKINATKIRHKVSISCDTEQGCVSGAGTYDFGEVVTLFATPNEHFDFEGFYDGNTLISTNNERSICVKSNCKIVAKFVPIEYDFLISGVPKGISVTGAGKYKIGETIQLCAEDNESFIFSNWLVNGAKINNKLYNFVFNDENIVVEAIYFKRLIKPVLSQTNNLIVWPKVENAKDYSVTINNNSSFNVCTNSINLSNYLELSGSGVISVSANGEGQYGNSVFANFDYCYFRPIDTPTMCGILSENNKIFLSFSKVNSAVDYSINIDNISYNLSSILYEEKQNSIKVEITPYLTQCKTYNIVIVALAQDANKNSLPSEVLSYKNILPTSKPTIAVNGFILTWSHSDAQATFYLCANGVKILLDNLSEYDLKPLYDQGIRKIEVVVCVKGFLNNYSSYEFV